MTTFFERFTAASTASIIIPLNPLRSRTCCAAMVVPPGEVTMARNSAGCFFVFGGTYASTIKLSPV